MGPDKKISIAVVRRLPRYYRYLGDLIENGKTRISSKELSEKMGITASQIRQDLNNFGCFGQQGFGYNVEFLHEEIKRILGLAKKYKLIIVGAGNLGQALANYSNFERRGFTVTGLFDINPKLTGLTVQGIKIYDIDSLEDFLKKNKVDIAVLSLPRQKTPDVAKKIFDCGIKGIWNFSNTDLHAPEGAVVENVHLTDSLMVLSYKMNEDE